MHKKLTTSALRRGVAKFGLDIRRSTPVSDMYECLIHYASVAGVTTLIDAGANTGQFARWMFEAGWKGRIVSFEPQSSAYELLKQSAFGNSQWEIAPRCALGKTRSRAKLNLAGNSESSSFLSMEDSVRNSGYGLDYIGTEDVDIITLSEWIDSRNTSENFLLKLDVQGFEADVIEGASRHLSRCPIIHTEMSLQSHYIGEPIFFELSSLIISHGYRCVGIRSGYYDSIKREVIQADGTFLSY